MGKWSGRVARKVYKKCHKRHGFYYRFWKLRVFSYMLVSWSVVEMTLRVEEEKWSADFFFPNLLVIVQKTQETSINIFVEIVVHLYICTVENLVCILTLPVFWLPLRTHAPKYRTTRKNTPQYCTPKHLLKYIDSRFVIYRHQQQQQYNQSSVWLANDVLI